MSGILRLESLTKGNTLKQGDKTPLKYRLFDADGDTLNITGKSAKVRLVYPDFLTIGYEKGGLTVAQDDTVTFTIDNLIPAKLYHVEIIVDDKFIFPSREDESKFTVDKSSLGTEANIVEVVGVDAVVKKAVDLINADPNLIIDEDKLVSDIISNTGIGSIEEYYQQFNDVIKELSKDKDYHSLPEIAGARGGFGTLGARLNDTSTQLAQKVDKGNVSVSDINKNLGKFDQTYMSEELLQQMAGNTPINAVPAPKSITTDKLADKSVTNDKISSDGLSGKHINGVYNLGTINKFDKDSITKGWYHNHIGNYHGPGPYSESQFIQVDSEKRYRTNAEIVTYWDSSGTFLSGETLIHEINEIKILNPDTEFVKIAMETTKVDTIMFTEADKYPYGKYVGYHYFAFDNDHFDVARKSDLDSMFAQKPSPLLEEISKHDFVFTIGYDDASSSIYEHAWPVHKAHDVPGTFWVTTGMMEGEVSSTTWGDIVTWDQLREMQNSDIGKITVGSHSHSHMDHGVATPAQLNSDASTAMDIFKREGFKPKYMSYPGGLSSALAKQYMSIYFKAARGAGVNEGFHIGHNNGESERYFTDSVNCDVPSVENIKGIITTAKNQKDKKKMVWLDIFVHMVHPSGFDTKGGVVKTPDQISEIIQFVKDSNGLVLSFDDAVSAFMENYYWTDHNSHQFIQ